MRVPLLRLCRAAVPALAVACGTRSNLAPLAPLPAPPPVIAPLAIHLAYPLETGHALRGDTVVIATQGETLPAVDSAFIYGSVGRGDATLSVNGVNVPVYPTGGWLAWSAVPRDSAARFVMVAVAGHDTVRAVASIPLARRFTPPARAAWIDSLSLVPRGTRWLRPGEGVRLGLHASPGAVVFLLLPDGRRVPFQPDDRPVSRAPAATAFEATTGVTPPATGVGRYLAWWGEGALGPDPGPPLAPLAAPDSTAPWPMLEVITGGDTARMRWPLRVAVIDAQHPPVVVVDDDTAHTGTTDSTLAGRPAPGAAYHWFFPNGTVAVVSGRFNDQVRLQLSKASAAWVDARDVQRAAAPPPAGVVRSVRVAPGQNSVTLRIPLPARVPFLVEEAGATLAVRLYGVAADMNWMQYGGTDPFVSLLTFDQPMDDETIVRVELSRPVFGYRTRWDGDDLLLEIRRPPPVDASHPLKGRRIAIDAGHPPLGARGPTGVREPDVTLAVALKAQALLVQAGAQVIMLRPDARPVGLVERIRGAERADAEVLVSIHANGLPEGINPFLNTGTSTYYFHPRSAPLARALDAALVRQFGFRDLGFGRGDLALVRPTWMPAALTEGLFLQMPDQEAVLGSAAGQERYARGIVEGIEAYLREAFAK